MEVLDRMGNKVNVGDKIAWVATSYGNAYLKIGNVTEIESKFDREFDDCGYIDGRWQKTGKMVKVYEVIVKADILHPYDLDRRYIARMPEICYTHEGKEEVCQIKRAEKI